jgi:replication factor A1
MHIKDTQLYYTSCPGEGCQKKVIETDNGWRCEKCDRSYEAPEYR